MSNKVLLAAIVIGLVALIIIGAIFLVQLNKTGRSFQELNMRSTVYAWCKVYLEKPDDECEAWADQMMTEHYDAIMSCQDNGSTAELNCIKAIAPTW